MIRIIFTIALIMGMSGSVFAGQKAKHQTSLDIAQDDLKHTLVCLPDSATAMINGVPNKAMSKQILNASIINNETSIWLYTNEYNVTKDVGGPDHTWVGVKNVNGIKTVAEMNFVTMIHTITSTSNDTVGILVSKCHTPYK
tara:strand:- start:533 stop:955 length:423 start_codon:yes stop_codon:yes gene_type:complete